MAKRTEYGLKGAISKRIQVLNPKTERYVKINTTTSRIIAHKHSPGPYKNIRIKK